MTLLLTCAGGTDIGLRRKNNEDAFIIREDRGFAALADGMGGAAAGEVASALFVAAAEEVLGSAAASADAAALVREVFDRAHASIAGRAAADARLRGMGCTAEVVLFTEKSYVVGHVGDSRTYLFREGRLRQITKDHSFVQEQLDRGHITEAEVRGHPQKNIITRAVGVDREFVTDIVSGPVVPGDLFLLCSDGLTDMIDDDSIRTVLASRAAPAEAVRRLISLALAAGGNDNTTAVLCTVGAA